MVGRNRRHGRVRRGPEGRRSGGKKTIFAQYSGKVLEILKMRFSRSLPEAGRLWQPSALPSLQESQGRQGLRLHLSAPRRGRENVGLGNFRRFGKQILRFGKKSFGDLAVQVRIAATLVGESIKNAISRRPQFYGIPSDGPRFFFGQRLRGLQKFLHFLLLARLGFQLCPNRQLSHGDFPPGDEMHDAGIRYRISVGKQTNDGSVQSLVPPDIRSVSASQPL